MKLTFAEIGLIAESLEERRSSLKWYAEQKDDDGSPAWPDELKKYNNIEKLIARIESTEV